MKTLALMSLRFILLISAFIFNGSCAKKSSDNNTLEVSVVDVSNLIPGTSNSCTVTRSGDEGGDIASKYFAAKGLKLTWTSGDSDLFVSYMEFKFKNGALSGGKLSCVVAGDELNALFWRDSADENSSWLGKMTNPGKGLSATYEMNCDYKCGGIAVTNLATISGTLRVVGFRRNVETQEEEPIEASTSISIVNSIAD